MLDLALFCRKLSHLLGAGLDLKTALPIVQGKSLGAGVNKAMPQVHKHILSGESFSRALELAGVFPPFMVGYVAIGEKTGQLASACEKLADYYETHSNNRRELLSALMYPLAIFVMMIGVVTLAMVTVLPGYGDIFAAANVPLPGVTHWLINVSGFFATHIVVILGVTALTIVVVVALVKRPGGQMLLARLAFKVPILAQGINLHLAQSLSMLLASHVNLPDAILLCRNLMDNPIVKADLAEASKEVLAGSSFYKALGHMPYLDPLLLDMVQVGEKTGDLPQAIEKCREYFGINYSHSIKHANKIVEPIITLAMGVLIALVMLAVVLPTFELATAI